MKLSRTGPNVAHNRAGILPGRHQAAFTLAEVMIASSIGAFVMAGVIAIMLQVGVEQRLVSVDTVLEQQAGNLQDRLTVTLRSMSAREGAILSDPVVDGQGNTLGFRRMIIAEGAAPDFPRQEIRFDSTQRTVIYDTNRNTSGNEEVIFTSRTNAVLRNLLFTPTLKADGSPDTSLVNLWIEIDDSGWGSRRTTTGVATNTVVQRFFSIKMRNN